MGKKKLGGFSSLIFRLGDTTTASSTTTTKPNPSSSSSWAWPSCKKQQQLRKDSLRGAVDGESVVYKNSAYLDSTDSSFLTHSSDQDHDNNSESFSTTSHDINNNNDDEEDSESLIRGLVRSSDHRLFVEPGGDTSSILQEDQAHPKGVNFKERSVAMAMESYDPYVDFKKSMEEMVAAHGLKDWECLEELLVWYLRVNGKKTHGYIVGAFVDLLVGLAAAAAAAADGHDDRVEAEEEESGLLLLPSSSYSSCCGSSSVSLSSRNCNYEIEEVLEDRSCLH